MRCSSRKSNRAIRRNAKKKGRARPKAGAAAKARRFAGAEYPGAAFVRIRPMLKCDTKPPHRAVRLGARMLGAAMFGMAMLAAAGCTPDAATGSANSSAVDPADGARIYGANCQPCHGPDGHGMPGVFPSLARSPVADGDPKALALWVLKGRRPASM